LNYRHAYHAGNFADVVKHLALVAAIQHLRRKETPFVVIDTHAGRGSYDLSSPEAQRTGEAQDGVGRLHELPANGTTTLSTYLRLARGDVYPGSPLISAELLRTQDRLVAVERHPEEAELLAEVLRSFRKAHVETADGYARLPALLPPPERRGLVLIDPPYETEHEFQDAARAFGTAFRRFATGTYMIWFPVKSASQANGFCGEVLAAGAPKVLRLDVMRGAADDGKLSAAGLLLVNPPWQFESEMRDALGIVLPLLGAEARFETLAGD
jgi:23S rRNA (adenine2030-N6)-methyltransferase